MNIDTMKRILVILMIICIGFMYLTINKYNFCKLHRKKLERMDDQVIETCKLIQTIHIIEEYTEVVHSYSIFIDSVNYIINYFNKNKDRIFDPEFIKTKITYTEFKILNYVHALLFVDILIFFFLCIPDFVASLMEKIMFYGLMIGIFYVIFGVAGLERFNKVIVEGFLNFLTGRIK